MHRNKDYGSMAQTTEVAFAGTAPSEINTLCDNVVSNLYNVNSAYKTLDAALKNIGTGRDNKGLRDNVHVTQLSTNQIISVTSKDIRKLNMLVKKGTKQQKLQAEKLTENFTEAVERYSSVQKQVATKMKANLLTIATIENEDHSVNQSNLEQIQLSRELAFEQDLLLEREVRVRQIEADILDVNEIMRELGALVDQQSEVIDSIENQIDHTAGNLEEGNVQLQKASEYQNKFRRKMFIIVIIAILIAAILIGILVSQLKKS